MKRRRMIKLILAGLALLILILFDINFNWWLRGYLAFGGEGLLYIVAVVYYIYCLVREVKHE